MSTLGRPKQKYGKLEASLFYTLENMPQGKLNKCTQSSSTCQWSQHWEGRGRRIRSSESFSVTYTFQASVGNMKWSEKPKAKQNTPPKELIIRLQCDLVTVHAWLFSMQTQVRRAPRASPLLHLCVPGTVLRPSGLGHPPLTALPSHSP